MSSAPSWFKFHIGDYLRDTEELSLAQHGAYLRLMCWYYSTAKPIPNDLGRICRRIGSLSVEERSATEFVLSEFFRLEDGFWHHKRIEEELRNYTVVQSGRMKGGEATKKKYKKIKESDEAIPGGEAGAEASIDPRVTKNQEPRTKKDLKALSSKLDDAHLILEYLNWKSGKKFLPIPSNLKMIRARIEESSVDLCKQVIDAKVVEWGRDEKMRKYIRPATIFNATNFGSYAGNDNPKLQARPPVF